MRDPGCIEMDFKRGNANRRITVAHLHLGELQSIAKKASATRPAANGAYRESR